MSLIEIKCSSEYDKFIFLPFNREIDQRHVEKLKEAIQRKNLLSISPCIISGANEIIDGQHRIEACRQLKIPFYYIVDKDLTHDDIIGLNNLKKGWTVMDFVNFFTIKKYPHFGNLSRLIVEYPIYGLNSILRICSSDGKMGLPALRQGKLDFGNYENFEYIHQCNLDWDRYADIFKEPAYIWAIRRMLMGEFEKFKYDHEFVMRVMQTHGSAGKAYFDTIKEEFPFNGEWSFYRTVRRVQELHAK